MNSLSWTFWITGCFLSHIDVMETASLLSLRDQALPASHSCSAASSPLSLHRTEESLGLALGGALARERRGWFDLPPRPLKLSPHQQRLFRFLIFHVFTGVALLISFQNVSFAFTPWLIGRGLAFVDLGLRHAFLTELNHF